MGGFAEVVRLGVKTLALSEVMDPEEMDHLMVCAIFFSVSSIDDFKLVLINLTEFPLAGTILLTIPSVVVFLLIYYNPLVSYFFMLFVSLVVSSMNKYISFFKSSTSLATSMNYSLRTFLRFS